MGRGRHLPQPDRRLVRRELHAETALGILVVADIRAEHPGGVVALEEADPALHVGDVLRLVAANPAAGDPVVGKRIAAGDLRRDGVECAGEHVEPASEAVVEMAVVDLARRQVAHAAHVLPRRPPVVDRPILVAERAAAGGVIDIELAVGHRRPDRVGDDPFGMPLFRRSVGPPATIFFRRRGDPRILRPDALGKAEHAETVFAAVEHHRDRHAALLQFPQWGGAVFARHLPDGIGGLGAPDRSLALAPLRAVHGLRLAVQHLAVLVARPCVGGRLLLRQTARAEDHQGVAAWIGFGESRQLRFIALRIVQPGDDLVVHISAKLEGIAPVFGEFDPGIGGQHPAESRQPRQCVAVT